MRKDINLLVWLTQLGISVAVPLAGFVVLGVWLHTSRGWGRWVIIAGLVFGISSAISGLRSSLKFLDGMASRKETDPPPLSFNDHD